MISTLTLNNDAPVRTLMSESDRLNRLYAQMHQSYGVSADDVLVVRAPLRICPLGAHIDHQHGIVTGMTIDQAILLAFAPTNDKSVRIQSTNFDDEVRFSLDEVPPYAPGDWGNYIRGAVIALQRDFQLHHGLMGYVDGEMPVGGLSSSAAVTVAYLLALQSVNELAVSTYQNIRLVSQTEQAYIGLRNGILDQTSILFSQPSCLTKIDCQDEDISQISAGKSMAEFDIMIVYSGVGKNLVGSGYNSRVAECQEAARLMLEAVGQRLEDPRLRHVSPEIFERKGKLLPDLPRKRAAHYFGEMARVKEGLNAWEAGDIIRFGELMNQSGESSVNLYECGCPQLITLYETLRRIPGVIGTRFSGAGFRGNCIALVDPNKREAIADEVHRTYPRMHPEFADQYSIHFCQTAGSALIL